MQAREVALSEVTKAHLVYASIPGMHSTPALVKISKQEVRSLIRSPQWANGYHLVPMEGSVNVLMLERCPKLDHAACAAA